MIRISQKPRDDVATVVHKNLFINRPRPIFALAGKCVIRRKKYLLNKDTRSKS